tara:strand:- start:7692 stop:8102 length:411 start_codon:yes stop_codon:yes gene_type:complete
MGTKRIGLARMEALVENLKREIVLGGTTLNDLRVAVEASQEGGANSGGATALSATIPMSLCATDTSKTHFSLAAGNAGQIKIIVHATRANAADCIVTPASFAGGSTLTSDANGRILVLVSDGTNWHAIESAGWAIA